MEKSQYYEKAKIDDEVYGTIFGHGKVSHLLQGYFHVMIEFDNGFQVPYTIEGIPGWGKFDYQTCFYAKDINIADFDFTPNDNPVIKSKQIIRLKEENKLEARTPSGVWMNANSIDKNYFEEIINLKKFHFLRKMK